MNGFPLPSDLGQFPGGYIGGSRFKQMADLAMPEKAWSDEARQAAAESRRGKKNPQVVDNVKGNLTVAGVRTFAGSVAKKLDPSKVPTDGGMGINGKPREKFWETTHYPNGMVSLKYNDEHPEQPDSGTVTANLFIGHAESMAQAGYEFKGYKKGNEDEYVFGPKD